MTILEVGHVESAQSTFLGSLPDEQLCHIVIGLDDRMTYCGYVGDSDPHGTYEGEAMCPVCGNPTCPKCVKLMYLDMLLEDDIDELT